MIKKDIQGFYDETGNLIGVFVSARLWQEIAADIDSVLEKSLAKLNGPICSEEAIQTQEALPSEPLDDWETFLKFWDFHYPVEKKVVCEICGQCTEDWTVDSPRKFLLKAANLGGLVSFLCLNCQARIIKRHFKDHITYETTPFVDRKKK
ncbi:hypothetical protein SAMN04488516_1094 [Desulfonauticus submarinus]|uniref:Uncharacterized protein n=1 Tax=Desulfonauticus submarinus TaxID=206665 RepID=A0A1H0EQI8_9BACT|nr:hypothetical protein [Desulfonauticus submarinus]SDN84618.1 hypothetical protein SAMN04488516_1094 [Desulfonauticus submarinus]